MMYNIATKRCAYWWSALLQLDVFAWINACNDKKHLEETQFWWRKSNNSKDVQNTHQCGSENDATTKIDVSEVPDFFSEK